APREIDIDIAAIDDLEINDGEILNIPHKGLFDRDFFLKTINQIEPEILRKLQNA
ncbi:MAG: 7,8-dihydro-6-hydroxymethylpterin-pyrophosphokinase, partial [Lentimonas sp.]